MARNPAEQPYNVIFAGKKDVGKSSLFKHIKLNEPVQPGATTTTIFDMFVHTTNCSGSDVTVKLWDTGNMERHGSMATSYFRHAVGVILVYSKADQDSLHSLRDWIDNSLDLNMWNQDKITFTVWGNEVESSDMVTGPTRVENGVVKQLIASTDIRVEDDLYCTVNSKTGAGVMESYRKLIAAVDAMIREDSRSYSTYTAAAAAPSTPTVVLANTSTENTRKKRCFC